LNSQNFTEGILSESNTLKLPNAVINAGSILAPSPDVQRMHWCEVTWVSLSSGWNSDPCDYISAESWVSQQSCFIVGRTPSSGYLTYKSQELPRGTWQRSDTEMPDSLPVYRGRWVTFTHPRQYYYPQDSAMLIYIWTVHQPWGTGSIMTVTLP
jgi:hypothetical protein